jgi:hypothetical protein
MTLTLRLRSKSPVLLIPILALTGICVGKVAEAEVSIAKTDAWELYTTGRVNAFFSYGFGDGYPQPLNPNETIIPGGGLNIGADNIPTIGPDGMPVPGSAGTFRSMRIRSGFVPNVMGLGLRSHVTDFTTLTVYLSLWTTLEQEGQRKTGPVRPDAREGYALLEGGWGSLLVGRALDLFSRGATENDFLYGHGYALGFPGNIDNQGPTNGLIGFGVSAAFFSAGIVYATPTKGGLKLTAGIYDPAVVAGAWEATRYGRPEGELTYDASSDLIRLHLFGNGAVQNLYRAAETKSATMYGVGYGGRLEVGAFHLGLAGHYGKGVGLSYALENSATTFSQTYALRTFDGYSGFAQVVAGRFDFNAGAGISRVFLLDEDKVNPNASVVKNQIGYAGVIVYHATPHLHFALDYMRGDYSWYLGEKQSVNFLSTGMTATW